MPRFTATGHDADRLTLGGRTGSGKTTFYRQFLMPNIDRLVFISPKKERFDGLPVLSAADFMGHRSPAAFLEEQFQAAPHIMVHFTTFGDMKRPEDMYATQLNAVARAAFELGNCCFTLDDVSMVVGSSPPVYVNQIWTAGRSQGVSGVAITQRVHRIPRVFLTEVDHVIGFRQKGREDVERLMSEAHPAFSVTADCRLPSREDGDYIGEFVWFEDRTETVHLPKRLRAVA